MEKTATIDYRFYGGIIMSQADEMYEGIEETIHELIKEYENQKAYTDCEEYRRQGSIESLEKLLMILND